MGVIYMATFSNGKMYIGQTSCTLTERMSQHKSDAKLRNTNHTIPFYNAIEKYGFDDITWKIIDTYIDKTDGNNKEKYWITKYNTYIHFPNSNGYNATLGGESRAELTKLSETQLKEIGEYYFKNVSAKEIANKYNVPLWTIQAIFRGERWGDYTHIPPRPTYIPHASIYSENEVDEILDKFVELGNIQHVAVWFKQKYNKGSRTSIRDIIKGNTWSEYSGITSDDFYNQYVQLDSKISRSGKGNSSINMTIANRIREIYTLFNNYQQTLNQIQSEYPNYHINYTIVRDVIKGIHWKNN